MDNRTVRIAVFASGKGSNFKAILEKFKHHAQIQVALLICDQKGALCLDIARESNVPSFVFSDSVFKTKWEASIEQDVLSVLREHNINFLVLAGFMRVLKSAILSAYPDKIINIHPSLLPSFKGLHAIRQAYEYGVKITGCTVHLVNEEIDGGRILGQSPVLISEGDSLEVVERKVHEAEHLLFSKTIETYITEISNKDMVNA